MTAGGGTGGTSPTTGGGGGSATGSNISVNTLGTTGGVPNGATGTTGIVVGDLSPYGAGGNGNISTPTVGGDGKVVFYFT